MKNTKKSKEINWRELLDSIGPYRIEEKKQWYKKAQKEFISQIIENKPRKA